jgi:hypothetical protein
MLDRSTNLFHADTLDGDTADTFTDPVAATAPVTGPGPRDTRAGSRFPRGVAAHLRGRRVRVGVLVRYAPAVVLAVLLLTHDGGHAPAVPATAPAKVVVPPATPVTQAAKPVRPAPCLRTTRRRAASLVRGRTVVVVVRMPTHAVSPPPASHFNSDPEGEPAAPAPRPAPPRSSAGEEFGFEN